MVGQIDREASYRRAIEVYAGAAEDPGAAASLLAGWTRLQPGTGRSTLLEEAAVLARSMMRPRLLETDALYKRSWCSKKTVCAPRASLRFNIHTWQTGGGSGGFACPGASTFSNDWLLSVV